MTETTTYTYNYDASGELRQGLTLEAAGRLRAADCDGRYAVIAAYVAPGDAPETDDIDAALSAPTSADGWFTLVYAERTAWTGTVIRVMESDRATAEHKIFEELATKPGSNTMGGWRDLRGDVERDSDFDKMIADAIAADDRGVLEFYVAHPLAAAWLAAHPEC